MSDTDEDLARAVQARVGQSVCGGRYAIEHVLGIGGMAAVYAGLHRNGHRVAMKFLHPELSRRADIRKRFLREGQAANAVHHPGVVSVVDDDVAEDGTAFLVMERLEGKSLERVWEDAGRRLPTQVVLATARDLCGVLEKAHAAGIFHRDLKPENLFLTNDGKLKVLDFGLAHLRDATRPKETHTGMVFGTPAFMPPEQASGQTSKIDARTDLWAVGATLFTLLSGELVHRGETAQHFVMLAATAPARSLSAVLPQAHPVLVEIVDRALAHEKDLRWQSAREMREAVLSGMELLLGDINFSLPGADDITKRKAISPALAVATIPSVEEISSDLTKVDAIPTEVREHDTEPNAPKAIVANSSDTPTQKRAADELPTQVRPLAPPGWSDLRNALEETKPRNGVVPAFSHEDTLLNQTMLRQSGRAVRRPHPIAPLPAALHAPFPTPGAPTPDPRAAKATVNTRRSPIGAYAPVIGAAVILALSPLAYFAVRNTQPPTTAGSAGIVGEPPPTLTSARGPGLSAPSATIEVAKSISVSTAVESVPATPPPEVSQRSPSRPTATAFVVPTGRGSILCSSPFVVDDAGVKRWKPECL